MSRAIPFALVGVIAVVAWGVGGYAPWATLVLQLASPALVLWVVLTVLFRTSREEREKNQAMRPRRWRLFGTRANVDVEILSDDDGHGSSNEPPDRPSRRLLIFGYAFRRTGAEILALGLTLWMIVSLVPLHASLLSLASPTALTMRNEIETLLGGESLSSAPWSVTPFLSYQDLLLWLAYLMIFWTSYHVAASATAAKRLSAGIVVVGIASAVVGLAQWLQRLGASIDEGAAALLTTGTFGNRNHYAMFQEMALMVSLGWLLLRWSDARRSPDRVSEMEVNARTGLVAFGVSCIALSLLFSLSRSGITFATAAVALLLFLGLRTRTASNSKSKSKRNVAPVVVALGLAVVTATFWIGIDPVLTRFELIPTELVVDDEGRAVVWRDSLDAVEDFWITGSGLSSFQYVYPMYRSFGGPRFYSWAHNDYLQIAVELGLPGLILTVLVIAWIARRSAAVRSSLSEQPGLRHLHAGYCAAALVAGLHSFTDFGIRLPANAALFSAVVGVATGLVPARRTRRRKTKVRKTLRRSPPAE